MNDKYEITPPSAHGAPDGFYVSRPRPLSTRFYVNSALLLAVGAVCILVGFLGKRVHEKSLNCEEEKKAAVSCDSETTTQKVIDGVAQCVPVLSCETGEVSEAGVCESKEKSQKVQAWKWVLLCAVILGMLYVVFRKGRGRARINPLTSTIEPTTGQTGIDSAVTHLQSRVRGRKSRRHIALAQSAATQLQSKFREQSRRQTESRGANPATLRRARQSLANKVGGSRRTKAAVGVGGLAAAAMYGNQFNPQSGLHKLVPVGVPLRFGTEVVYERPETFVNPNLAHEYQLNERGETDSLVPDFGERVELSV